MRGLSVPGAVAMLFAVGCGSSTSSPSPHAASGGAGGVGGKTSSGDAASPRAEAGVDSSSGEGSGGATANGNDAAARGPNSSDAASIEPSLCGNGQIDPGEDCDDGNTKNGDGCNNNCQFSCSPGHEEFCQDGNYCNGPEQCGADHVCLPSTGPLQEGAICGQSQKCQGGRCLEATPDCGDGLIEVTEECEDGNTVNGDGCDQCRFTCASGDPARNCKSADPCPGQGTCNDITHLCSGAKPLKDLTPCGTDKACVGGQCSAAYCSNAKNDPGEECDDGNLTADDGCEPDCRFTCIAPDVVRDCHSTNACVNSGACSASTHTCSPLLPKAAGTVCGPGGKYNCVSGNCITPICGDGIVAQGVEACDDGNAVNGDGCDSDCTKSCVNPLTDCPSTPQCRVALCVSAKCSSTPDAAKNNTACNISGAAACHQGACTSGTCGNGIKETGEQCDDNNQTAGDGCEPNCTFSCSANADCSDGDPCNGAETCVTGGSGKQCATGTGQADGTACGGRRICVRGSCRPSFCGDGITDSAAAETCDPPNTVGCDQNCKALALCNLTGTWAMKVTAKVAWGDGAVLIQATGDIQQWARFTITQLSGSRAFTATVEPCGLVTPDFQTTTALLGETYGTTFPDSTFDKATMPKFQTGGTLSNLAPGAQVDTSEVAVLLGVTIGSPATPFGAWPDSLVGTPGFALADQDGDGKLGITAVAKTGAIPGGTASYLNPIFNVNPPASVSNPDRADRLYLALRSIVSESGTLTSCSAMSGAAAAVLDNHVVGCRAVGGTDCADASLVDAVRPIYIVNSATFSSVLLTSGTTCSAVRAAVP